MEQEKVDLLKHPEVNIITLSRDELPKLINARELSEMEIPEPEMIVQDLIPIGANMIAGKPKGGKSILAMNISLAVAQGGKALSFFSCEKHGVLYLCYEDSLPRLRKRINMMKKMDYLNELPKNLHFPFEPYDFPTLNENGMALLQKYLERLEDIKLIVIDTLGRGIDPKVYAKGVNYNAEYGYNSILHRFAHKNNISLLIIHHTRKAPAEDDSDEILGTNGVAGSMDNLYILKKVNGNFVLHTKGRDIEDKEYRIKQVKENLSWIVEGENQSITLSEEKQEIVDLLTDENRVMRSGEIAKELEKKVSNISKHIKSLEKDGILFRHGYGLFAIFPKEEKQSKTSKSGKSIDKQLNLEEDEEELE